MGQEDTLFDDQGLRKALKRTCVNDGASRQLNDRVAAMLRASAPDGAPSHTIRQADTGGRVFGLPRVWGLAAAVAMLIVGGSLITYQLLPSDRRPIVTQAELMKQTIASLLQVHQHVPDDATASTDLSAFQRTLPSVMPVASLPVSSARFLNARVDQFQGQLCYVVQYQLDGKPISLLTAAVAYGYQVPDYNATEGGVRLVGGPREGWLVCIMGDASVPASKYQSLLNEVKLLASPSTQSVTSAFMTRSACP